MWASSASAGVRCDRSNPTHRRAVPAGRLPPRSPSDRERPDRQQRRSASPRGFPARYTGTSQRAHRARDTPSDTSPPRTRRGTPPIAKRPRYPRARGRPHARRATPCTRDGNDGNREAARGRENRKQAGGARQDAAIRADWLATPDKRERERERCVSVADASSYGRHTNRNVTHHVCLNDPTRIPTPITVTRSSPTIPLQALAAEPTVQPTNPIYRAHHPTRDDMTKGTIYIPQVSSQAPPLKKMPLTWTTQGGPAPFPGTARSAGFAHRPARRSLRGSVARRASHD